MKLGPGPESDVSPILIPPGAVLKSAIRFYKERTPNEKHTAYILEHQGSLLKYVVTLIGRWRSLAVADRGGKKGVWLGPKSNSNGKLIVPGVKIIHHVLIYDPLGST